MKLNVKRDGNAVGVWLTPDIFMSPAGFGPTLAEALRQMADQLEQYHCNVTPKQLDQDEGEILEWMRSQVEAIYVQQGRTTRESQQ